MASDGLIELNAQGIDVKPAGRLLVRSLCMLFDRYLSELNQQRFSGSSSTLRTVWARVFIRGWPLPFLLITQVLLTQDFDQRCVGADQRALQRQPARPAGPRSLCVWPRGQGLIAHHLFQLGFLSLNLRL